MAKRKRNLLSNKARIRRDSFINKCDLDEDAFRVLDNGGNDSLAFKTSFYDFRGEKNRDKSLDISPKRFILTTFMTNAQRVQTAETLAKNGLFSERNHTREEKKN